ncbi:MAG: dephospho-CoA kinase [Verrucomicrobiota bacterium]
MKGIRLGLTGTIGSGKSTTLSFFANEGWITVRTDDLAREELERSEMKQVIRERWGSGIFDSGGRLKRKSLAGIVFSDPQELEWLESVLHPRVRERWLSITEKSEDLETVVEIPLLFEKSLASHFDFVVSVSCPENLQLERLLAKGLTADDIEARKLRQLPAFEKESRAHHVLSNCGTLTFLEKQVISLSEQLRLQTRPSL